MTASLPTVSSAEANQPEANQPEAKQQEKLSLPPTLRRVVLGGFMGAGKTTVGKLLAQAMGWDFLDLDTLLEQRAGMSIPEIFRTQGEAAFRRLESLALVSALGRSHTVLALGGGTVEELTNRLLLEQTPGTHVVYLAAPFAVLYDRCMLQSFAAPTVQRPVLTDAVEAERRYTLRHPLYTRLACQTVQTQSLESEGAARAVLDHLLSTGRAG